MKTNQNYIQPANSDRQDKTKSITWKTSLLTDKQNFRFKDCIAWSQYQQTNTMCYLRGEVDPNYPDCTSLNIPANANPWNVLRSVIDQFYKREIDIAWELFKSRKATEKAKKLEEKNEELQEIFWKQDKCIGELETILEKNKTLNDAPATESEEPENDDAPAYYTLEDCKAYNDFQRNMCKQYSPHCTLLAVSENTHPWNNVYNLIELYYDRDRQLHFAIEEIERLKAEKVVGA